MEDFSGPNMAFQLTDDISPQYGVSGNIEDHLNMDEVPNTLMHHSINYFDGRLDFLLSEALASTQDQLQHPIEPLGPAQVGLHTPVTETPATVQSSGLPLEASHNVSYRIVGPTGDLDLYVLRHRNYDENDESSVRYRGLRYRRMSTSSVGSAPPPVFTISSNMNTAQTQPRLHRDDIEQAEKSLSEMISPKLACRLVLLYTHYVHPHFPILSARQLSANPEDMNKIPPALLAALCATAIPFITYDDVLSIWLPESPSKDEVFRLAWILLVDELHTPHLSTIQTCLLLLQSHATSRYLPLTSFKPALLSTTVALAHCLGLHRDSSQWATMPLWERRLRKRIWWATWMMDKWICLGESVPSTLKNDENDVAPLLPEDFEDDLLPQMEPMQPIVHFNHLVSLTSILDEIYRTFFSVRAAANTATNIDFSLEAARPLRAKLKHWHDELPPNLKRQGVQTFNTEPSQTLWSLNAHGSFYLAYLTAQLTLFRALLRPVSAMASLPTSPAHADNADAEQIHGPKAVITGALTVVEEVIVLAESLSSSEWDAFWHSCTLSSPQLTADWQC